MARFEDISNMLARGVELAKEARGVFAKVKAAVTDGQTAINAASADDLLAQLDREEQETKAAIADARDAIAQFRRG